MLESWASADRGVMCSAINDPDRVPGKWATTSPELQVAKGANSTTCDNRKKHFTSLRKVETARQERMKCSLRKFIRMVFTKLTKSLMRIIFNVEGNT